MLLKTTTEEAEKAAELALSRYERGITPLTDLLDTQRIAYTNKQRLLQAEQNLWQARISLILALGGNWLGQTHDMSPFIKDQMD